MPYFELDEALRIARETAGHEGEEQLVFDPERNVFVSSLDDDEDKREYPMVQIGAKSLYSIGGGYWTWSEA